MLDLHFEFVVHTKFEPLLSAIKARRYLLSLMTLSLCYEVSWILKFKNRLRDLEGNFKILQGLKCLNSLLRTCSCYFSHNIYVFRYYVLPEFNLKWINIILALTVVYAYSDDDSVTYVVRAWKTKFSDWLLLTLSLEESFLFWLFKNFYFAPF